MNAKPPSSVLPLVFGLLLTVFAFTSLWASLIGTVNWEVARIAAPVILVIIGVVGVFLTHNRDRNKP